MACSILIPTHNRPTVLCEAVLSALAGCPEDGEVLVVDDRSVPPAANALAEMTDKRLRIISSERPPGASGTRNTGIRRASHDVILFLDDDDLMIADYPGRVVRNAAAHREVSYGIANHRRLDLKSGRIEEEAISYPEGILPDDVPMRRTLVSAGRGLWARRDALIEVGAFDEAQATDEDTSLSIRFRLAGLKGYFDPSPGVVTRLNVSNETGEAPQLTTSQLSRQYDAYLGTYRTFAGRFSAFSPERWFLLTRFLRRAAKLGRGREALSVVLEHRPLLVALVGTAYLGTKTLRHRKTSALAKE